MNRIEMLYPERRTVSESEVLLWATDSYHNNADSYRCSACGEDTRTQGSCVHETDCIAVYADGTVAPAGLIEAMEWLEDQGEATFSRRSRPCALDAEDRNYQAGYAYASGYPE